MGQCCSAQDESKKKGQPPKQSSSNGPESRVAEKYVDVKTSAVQPRPTGGPGLGPRIPTQGLQDGVGGRASRQGSDPSAQNLAVPSGANGSPSGSSVRSADVRPAPGSRDAEAGPPFNKELSPMKAAGRVDVFNSLTVEKVGANAADPHMYLSPVKPGQGPSSSSALPSTAVAPRPKPPEKELQAMAVKLTQLAHCTQPEALYALKHAGYDFEEALSLALAYNMSPATNRNDLLKGQNAILPSHLRRSQTISEILLESSVVGRYVMLPWNEGDEDVKENFWCGRPLPPRVITEMEEKLTQLKAAIESGGLPPSSTATASSGPHAPADIRANPHLSPIEENLRPPASSRETRRWTDPDGFVALSVKQNQKFHRWKRFHEVNSDPMVILDLPSSQSIRQGFVGDCSFLSSLAVLCEFENKTKLPVLSGIMYPQSHHVKDRNRIMPVVNQNGMYACRLFFNGVPRKVMVDDYVPCRKDGRILAAHSGNKREMWVTFLEKAFVKLMGGSYFMQGSNPGADLYHLTGWIPETIPFKSELLEARQHALGQGRTQPTPRSAISPSDIPTQQLPKWADAWKELFNGWRDGRCVACLGTSEIEDAAPSGLEFPEGVSISSGIVARHAYSIIRCSEAYGNRLLFVKNPWGVMRWKGEWAPNSPRWTKEMRKALDYDPEMQSQTDNGCFWIDWLDVIRWFSHLYICWNSTCFPFEAEAHSRWERSAFIEASCLADDSHLVAFNPQFHLRISPPSRNTTPRAAQTPKTPFKSQSVAAPLPPVNMNDPQIKEFMKNPVDLWILLSRHVRERKRDLALKYLAVHIHEGSERVSCPPPPAKQGVYSNGECTLVKLKALGEGEEALKTLDFVLVVSQYSQKDEFSFTLKVFSHLHTVLRELPPAVPSAWAKQSRYLMGKWEDSTAGGCSNDLWEYFKNPHFRLVLPERADVLIFLECPLEHSVNVRVFKGSFATPRTLRTGKALSSGPYRAGCCTLRQTLEPGPYVLVASTFRVGEVGDFQMCVHSSCTQAPVLEPMPYPHACPPPSPMRHVVKKHVSGQPPSQSFDGRAVLLASTTTQVSLRLVVKELLPVDATPSVITYRFPSNDVPSRDGQREAGGRPSAPSWQGLSRTAVMDKVRSVRSAKELRAFHKSDLEGGLSDDGRTTSTAAANLYTERKVVTMTLLTIQPHLGPVMVCVSSSLREAAVGSWELHVISDNPVEVIKLDSLVVGKGG
uniref:Calpain catalytic domain-containing protein n=1 Tax=Chromera velia CCMP2878 TaxID=1169474 RepID=A0A0G4GVB9_9ALVE|eukprot:Cvel_23549.t1-p1 / transcript=Cvel_23549.t1 / gene=Cvel_23549 / organism=Chromera_velia_CCMP2878 / gene_product=Calpain-7, putative / transcript_product=Calpain-7, putative / location=Cvel_scaffold2439:11342-19929(-) / protein_length=1217 / sequence_SO=supercontig / SO=protein_coding / is_pseudo=false